MAVVAASCAGSDEAQIIADRVLANQEAVTSETAVDTALDCTVETVEDEYGVDIDIQVCGDETLPIASISNAPIDGPSPLDSGQAAAASAWFAELVLRPCRGAPISDPPVVPGFEINMAQMLPAATALASSCDDLDAFVAAHAAMRGHVNDLSAALLGVGFAAGGDLAEPVAGSALAAQAVATTEWIAWALDPDHSISRHRNPLFWGYSARGHLNELADGAPISTAILGTSQTQYGVAAQAGGSAFNYSIPGATPSLGLLSLEQILAAHPVDRLVIGVSTTDFLVTSTASCEPGAERVASYRRSLEFQASMFADSPEPIGLADVLGDPRFEALLDRTPLAIGYAQNIGRQGRLERYPVITDRGEKIRFDGRAKTFDAWIVCELEFESFESMISRATAANAEVFVLIMPLRSDLVVRAPGQGDGVSELNAQIVSRSEALGAQVIDVSTLDDSNMLDAVHVTSQGRDTISTIVESATE